MSDPSGHEPPALTEVQIAQSANVLEAFVNQVNDAKPAERGVWQRDRVQALYGALMSAGEELPAVSHTQLLAIMLAIAIDQIAENRPA